MFRRAAKVAFGFAAGSASAYCVTRAEQSKDVPTIPTDVYKVPQEAGARRKDLPEYTVAEIMKHKAADTGIWVTFADGVYDITDFVDAHPGGEKILLAAGSSIEPFWQIYQVHRESDITLKLLESMRIGNVNAQDRVKQLKDAAADPYANEPPRHPAMQVLSMRPFNSEPPRDLLALSFFTPNDIFYVRNHLPVPHVQKEGYAVSVKFGRIEKKFTLDDLRKFPQVTVPVTLQCAGNRRRGMSSLRSVDGLMWDTGAISTATWTGVRLADVLRKVGVTDDGARKKGWKHVVFEGHDGGPDGKYGASISYDRATDAEADVILAWEMNGTELPKDHGFPLRVVVPGLVGARSVKWLNSIEVSEKESQSIWQQKDYKNIGPSFLDRLTAAAAAKEAPPVKEMPVQSAILIPDDSEGIKADQETVIASGYACGGGGRGIHRVDVTPDNGNTWIPAELYETDEGKTEGNKTYGKLIDRPMPQQWAWTLWRAEVPVSLKKKEFELCAKAVNTANDTQPETPKGIWNLRGLLNNSWHCIHIKRDE